MILSVARFYKLRNKKRLNKLDEKKPYRCALLLRAAHCLLFDLKLFDFNIVIEYKTFSTILNKCRKRNNKKLNNQNENF